MIILGFQLDAQKYEVIAEGQDFKVEKTKLLCTTNLGYEYVYVALKFTNLSQEDIVLDFIYEMWYSGECSNCEFTDLGIERSISIPANSVIEGDCNNWEYDFLMTLSHSKTDLPHAFKGQLTDLIIGKVQLK